MESNSTVGALKRRWWVIVLFALIGGVLGALPQPAKVEEQVRTFTATHTMLLNDQTSTTASTISPEQVTLFAGTGEVPKRTAEAIGFDGNPATLASQITASFDFATGAVTVSTTQ